MAEMGVDGNSTSVAMPRLEIYRVGGCELNPGPGGYSVVLLNPKKRPEASSGFRLTAHSRVTAR